VLIYNGAWWIKWPYVPDHRPIEGGFSGAMHLGMKFFDRIDSD